MKHRLLSLRVAFAVWGCRTSFDRGCRFRERRTCRTPLYPLCTLHSRRHWRFCRWDFRVHRWTVYCCPGGTPSIVVALRPQVRHRFFPFSVVRMWPYDGRSFIVVVLSCNLNSRSLYGSKTETITMVPVRALSWSWRSAGRFEMKTRTTVAFVWPGTVRWQGRTPR